MPLENFHLSREILRSHHVIGVNQCDVPSARDSQTRVPSDGRAAVRLMSDVVEIPSCKRGNDSIGVICRAIVNDNDLDIRKRLLSDRTDALLEIVRIVEGGYEDGH
jgi:hypothetical protein